MVIINDMNASELRVGNYISGMYDGENELFCNCKVVCLDIFDIAEYPIHVVSDENSEYFYEFKPIELTEEWLLKFGFNKEYKKGWIGIDVKHENGTTTDFVLAENYNMGEWQNFYAFVYNEYRFVELKYVHQLQNLFFAMTNKELTLNNQTK